MPVERCMLCGGRLNGNRICTDCGMDNKKNDRHYRLNENLSTDTRQGEPGKNGAGRSRQPSGNYEQNPGNRQPRGTDGRSRTRGAAAGGWRNSRQSGSSFSGKVVFLIMLLIVILTGVLGFLGES